MKTQPENKPASPKTPRAPLTIYLAYLFIFSLLLIGVSFSRYRSTSAGGDSARVAAAILTVTDDNSQSSERILNLGLSQTKASWDFTVSNGNLYQTSEVSFQYDVIVELDTALPEGVTLSLVKQEGTLTTDLSPTSDSSESIYYFEDVGVLQAGASSSQDYELIFDLDLNNLTEGSNLKFTITVRAEQID